MNKKYDLQTAIDLLFINISNSIWAGDKLTKDEIGDGWVENYFSYPQREIIKPPYKNEQLLSKAVHIPDSFLLEFIPYVLNLGFKSFIMKEVFDCDSLSMRADAALKIYLRKEDFEKLIEPKLKENLELDFKTVVGFNNPDRIILLGGYSIKQSELQQYWKIIGADTDEKRMWNTPTHKELYNALNKDKKLQ